jgi:hypothetical protein
MRKFGLAALVLLLALPAAAQQNALAYFYHRHDVDATAITYCRSEGQNGDPFGAPMAIDAQVDNAGSSTTIDQASATGEPFRDMGVGDTFFIHGVTAGSITPRSIVTASSSTSVVVDEAIDLSADNYNITWRNDVCGTAVTSGWISTAGLSNVTIGFFLTQYVGDGNGLDVRIEGTVETSDGTTNIVQLWPTGKTVGGAATVQNFTTAGIATNIFVNITAPVQKVRVGAFHNTADDGNDLTTNAEQITVALYATREAR